MHLSDRKSILVVDDEEVIREFLMEVLGEDYQITTAEDGEEAIQKIKDENYDLIITDIKMPKVSGEEVVKFAREKDSDSRVIMISGYSSLFAATESVESGACAFLSKPFSIKQLLQTVTDSLEGR